jgi:phosphoribosylamine-glycine ligase
MCEDAVGKVTGEHIYHRRDIGTRELLKRKLARMKAIR